ncbi:uncharacterized protein LOC135346856 isoform X2 [Halichondria panicea]|uniref:uncharacterized protein LOC135346856 isoform X2 n=1 Tax=Halichondria panicea TaxID=6063 RepID=UPI00312B52BA
MGSAQRRRSRGHGQEEDTRKHQIRRVGWTSILHSLMLNPDLPRRIHFMLDLRELGANKKPRHFSSQPGSRPNHKVRQGVPRQALLPTTKASNFSEKNMVITVLEREDNSQVMCFYTHCSFTTTC